MDRARGADDLIVTRPASSSQATPGSGSRSARRARWRLRCGAAARSSSGDGSRRSLRYACGSCLAADRPRRRAGRARSAAASARGRGRRRAPRRRRSCGACGSPSAGTGCGSAPGAPAPLRGLEPEAPRVVALARDRLRGGGAAQQPPRQEPRNGPSARAQSPMTAAAIQFAVPSTIAVGSRSSRGREPALDAVEVLVRERLAQQPVGVDGQRQARRSTVVDDQRRPGRPPCRR